MQRTDGMFRPRLPISAKLHDVGAGARHESERWIEGGSDALVGTENVPEIIRVVHLHAQRASVAVQVFASRSKRPQADHETLIAAKPRRAILEIGTSHPA